MFLSSSLCLIRLNLIRSSPSLYSPEGTEGIEINYIFTKKKETIGVQLTKEKEFDH